MNALIVRKAGGAQQTLGSGIFAEEQQYYVESVRCSVRHEGDGEIFPRAQVHEREKEAGQAFFDYAREALIGMHISATTANSPKASQLLLRQLGGAAEPAAEGTLEFGGFIGEIPFSSASGS
jgi:hypothetical protein